MKHERSVSSTTSVEHSVTFYKPEVNDLELAQRERKCIKSSFYGRHFFPHHETTSPPNKLPLLFRDGLASRSFDSNASKHLNLKHVHLTISIVNKQIRVEEGALLCSWYLPNRLRLLMNLSGSPYLIVFVWIGRKGLKPSAFSIHFR